MTVKIRTTTMVHIDGPITVHVSRNENGPYAVIGAGDFHLFPDAEALDSLISEATAVRAALDQETGRDRGMLVRRIDDDAPVPQTGRIVAQISEDWCAVVWRNATIAGQPSIEALDELTGAER